MNEVKASVLSVGQCNLDHGNISALLKRELGTVVDAADTVAGTLEAMASKSYDIVLVNRIFDATGDEGIAFIRSARNNDAHAGATFMLVSNFDGAQAAAVAAGAVPGFGKDSLDDPRTLALLAEHLNGRYDS